MAGRTAPIVIKLGKASKRRIKLLKQGEGPLVEDVQSALAEVRSQLGKEADDKELVPVVILYRRKKRASGLLDL